MTQVDSSPRSAALSQFNTPPRMLNHFALVTPDAAATVDFYTRVLNMKFVQALVGGKVPSTGEPIPYFHIFLRMDDGSTVAFFEAPGLPDRPAPPHPAYDTFDHLALHADSVAEVDEWHQHLLALGLEVVGPTRHPIAYSIYFRDPINNLRLEITTPLTPDWNDQEVEAAAALTEWIAAKRSAAQLAAENGTEVGPELSAMIIRQQESPPSQDS
jgi:catechol 2,3-dioxygenase-like lactoylglutathione lyase family enzyme